MAFKDLLGKLRGWIDDDEETTVSPEKARGPSRWEQFLISVARGIEEVMQDEMFTPPGGPTYIPREYIVFMSKEDDAEWQGEKREGLERGLHTVIAERARELVGAGELQTRTITIELRVDANLEKGKFRVLPVWDKKAEATQVKPRLSPAQPKSPPPAPVSAPAPAPAVTSGPATPAPPTKPLTPQDDLHEAPTIVKPNPSPQAAPAVGDEEATRVRPRAPLFSVSVFHNGVHDFTYAAHKNKITIGRGNQEDIKLVGDMEVSRSHIQVEYTDEGKFFVTCLGRNSILVGKKEVVTNEREEIAVGDVIQLCGFSLSVVSGQSSVVL